MRCYYGDNGDVIRLSEAECGLGNCVGRRTAEGSGPLKTKELAAIGGFGNAICEQCEAISMPDLKTLFVKHRIPVEPEWERGWADEFLPIVVWREMTGIGEDEGA